MKYPHIALWLITSTLIMSGCIPLQQSFKKTDYYTLEYPAPKIEGLKPLSLALSVEHFRVSPLCNSTKIFYRDRKFMRKNYFYHKWRANPGKLVTFFLARDLEASGIFKAVSVSNQRIPSSHVIEGTVDEFFEKDGVASWEAALTIGITLMSRNEADASKIILFQKKYSVSEICTQKNPRSLAAAMSKAMARASAMIIKDLYAALQDS